MLTSLIDAYISKYGDYCANDNDTTDYFTPYACTRDNYPTMRILFNYRYTSKYEGSLRSPLLTQFSRAILYITIIYMHRVCIQSNVILANGDTK